MLGKTNERATTESLRSRNGWRWLIIIIMAICSAACAEKPGADSRIPASPADPKIEIARTGMEKTDGNEANRDFSKFTHENEGHSRLPCLLCHRREGNEPQPKLPGHTPCAGCHAQVFKNSSSPICVICHTNVQTGEVKAFPKLKTFNVKFDHAQHIGAGRSSTQCATCHKPRGVSLSIPGGPGGHVTCFQCHDSRALGRDGQDIASCSTCHTVAGYVRTSDASRAYKISFSHVKHNASKKLNCISCHSIRAGMAQGRQVSSPAPAMHRASPRGLSCAACHDDKRAFGVANSSDCKKCHQGTTWRM